MLGFIRRFIARRRAKRIREGFDWATNELNRYRDKALGYLDLYVYDNDLFSIGVLQAVQEAYNNGLIKSTTLGPVYLDDAYYDPEGRRSAT